MAAEPRTRADQLEIWLGHMDLRARPVLVTPVSLATVPKRAPGREATRRYERAGRLGPTGIRRMAVPRTSGAPARQALFDDQGLDR